MTEPYTGTNSVSWRDIVKPSLGMINFDFSFWERSYSNVHKTNTNIVSSSTIPKGPHCCKFGHKERHFQRRYPKIMEWLAKNYDHLFIVDVSFNVSVPVNTWWVDSGSMVHVANTLQVSIISISLKETKGQSNSGTVTT